MTMKRIVIVLVMMLAAAVSASAQYADNGSMTAKGSRIFLDGEKLSPEKAAAMFSTLSADKGEDYLRYRKGYKTGVGLSVGGASLLVVGSAAFCVSSVLTLVSVPIIGATGNEVPKEFEAAIYGSLGSAALGAVVMIAGIPTAAVYQHRIKKLAGEYNSAGQAKPALTFGPTTSGLGIAMTF